MAPKTMKSVALTPSADGKSFTQTIEEIPIPTPGPNEVLIRIITAGANPKDWKLLVVWGVMMGNTGDDMAGYVEAVGSEVYEFKKGDRVGAFHVMMAAHGAYAEYGIAPAHVTFHIPQSISFEAAATIPMAYLTAVHTFSHFGLPDPFHPAPAGTHNPIIIYGGSTAVGSFALKLCRAANIGPVITVAGAGSDYVRSIAPEGTIVVDYRKGNVQEALEAALRETGPCRHAFETVGDDAACIASANALGGQGGGTVAYLLNPPEGYTPTAGVELESMNVGWSYHVPYPMLKKKTTQADVDFTAAMIRWVVTAIVDGRMTPHPHQVVEGGLNGVEKGLKMLMNNEVSAKKLVFRVAEE